MNETLLVSTYRCQSNMDERANRMSLAKQTIRVPACGPRQILGLRSSGLARISLVLERGQLPG